jgi:hypothetical protein
MEGRNPLLPMRRAPLKVFNDTTAYREWRKLNLEIPIYWMIEVAAGRMYIFKKEVKND